MLQTLSSEIDAGIENNTYALEAVARLFHNFNQLGLRYCHWKSNLRLKNGLLGETDLDLLIDPHHRTLFNQIIAEHDLKPVLPAPGKDYPGVEHYLGFDPPSGNLFHLHVHYQLVLGEQFVKSYCLPIEDQFLDSVQQQLGVKVPVPEMELIVLTVRALLKYRDRDALKDVLSIRSPGIPDHILEEIEWLAGQTSMERISRYLNRISTIVPGEIIQEFLDTMIRSRRNGVRLFRLRRRIRLVLRPYQRQGRFKSSLRYFWEYIRQTTSVSKLFSGRKMSLINGGRTIALVGADGSGKSSMSALLAKWLSWKLDVYLFYLGSKQPSLLSKTLYLLFRMARRAHHDLSEKLGKMNLIAQAVENLRQALLYCHHLSTGYDRYRRYRSGIRIAGAGALVIFDRYPLKAPLDGPRILLDEKSGRRPILNFLYTVEQNLYKRIKPPDFCLMLDVSPEVSLQRKPDHHPEKVASKCRFVNEIGNLSGPENGWNLLPINANLPFEDVVNQIKKTVWNVL